MRQETNVSLFYLELLRINPGVDPETVERRLFDRVSGDGASETERELHAVHVAEVGVVDAVLDGFDLRIWRGLLPHHHDRQVRLLLDDEPRREVGRPRDVENVGFAFRRLAERCVFEGQRIAAEGRGEHPERQTDEILFDPVDTWL